MSDDAARRDPRLHEAAAEAAKASRDADLWRAESMRFRFQLGENQFYARHFDVAVYTPRFLEITGEPEAITLPLDRYAGRVAAYVVLSHPITHPLPILTVQPEVIRYASHQYNRGYVRIEGSFDDYLRGLSSSKRNQLKRKVKKFKERAGGEIQFAEYADAGRMREFHALAREVSAKTYQEKLFKKGLPTDDEFLRDMDARTRSTGVSGTSSPKARARGFLLFDGKQPIAYLYATIDDGFLTYDYVGYDPEHSALSPGNVLQYMILERVFADKICTIFDFGEGESQYKEFFSTHATRCADIYFFPRDARGYALASSQAGLFFVSRGVVRALDRLGLKQRVKQMLRGTRAAVPSGGSGGGGKAEDGGEREDDAPGPKNPTRKPPSKRNDESVS